jgi:hypothetical protein
MRLLLGVSLAALAVWAYKQIGFIRQEPTIAELKRRSDIFAPTAPRYRQTQRPKVRIRLLVRKQRAS